MECIPRYGQQIPRPIFQEIARRRRPSPLRPTAYPSSLPTLPWLVPTYLAECRKRCVLQVRIIHGKGTGQLRERVNAILRRIPGVAAFILAPEGMGGWGATVVELKP